MTFTTQALLYINEVECPPWATLSMVTTEDGIQAVRDENATSHFMTSALSNPHFLNKHRLNLNSPFVALVFLQAQIAVNMFRQKIPGIPVSASTMKKY